MCRAVCALCFFLLLLVCEGAAVCGGVMIVFMVVWLLSEVLGRLVFPSRRAALAQSDSLSQKAVEGGMCVCASLLCVYFFFLFLFFFIIFFYGSLARRR